MGFPRPVVITCWVPCSCAFHMVREIPSAYPSPRYGSHDLSGALFFPWFLACPDKVVIEGSLTSLQEPVYLPFVPKLMKGLLEFSTLDYGVTILLMELTLLSRIIWLRVGYKL